MRFVLIAVWPAVALQIPDLREAARLDQAGKCAEAEKIYHQALSQPAAVGPLFWNNLGNHYLICRQPDKAGLYFEKVVAAVPSHLNANLALARMEIAGGAFPQAEQRLSKLAAGHPADFNFLLLYGIAAGRAGHAAKAKQILEEALRLRPDDLTVMVEAGLANAASGDYPRAVFLLARAHTRTPNIPSIALALARAAEDAGYYGDAVVAYERFLKLQPGNVEAQRDRARVSALAGNAQAIGELRNYVRQHPSDALGHFYLAQVIWREDAEIALRELAEALRINPQLAPAHSARAWLLHRMGNSEEALPHLRAAVTLRPEDHRSLDQMGVVLLSLDRAQEAESALRKAARLAPKDPAVALHLGRALLELGREAEGQQWIQAHERLSAGRQRDPRREPGMIDLAVMDPTGQRAREIERFRMMASSRPDDPLLQMNLAALLMDDGQTAAAMQAYKTLAAMNAGEDIWVKAAARLWEAGHPQEARTFYERAGLPPDPLATAMDDVLHGRASNAETLLRKAGIGGAEFHLLQAISLALHGDSKLAIRKLNTVEAQWPDWGKARLVHGLMLREQNRRKEAAAQFQQAAALGAREEVSQCATLREWVSGSCGK